MKVMLSKERRVSTAAKMSAWRAREWFLLSDSRLRAKTRQMQGFIIHLVTDSTGGNTIFRSSGSKPNLHPRETKPSCKQFVWQ